MVGRTAKRARARATASGKPRVLRRAPLAVIAAIGATLLVTSQAFAAITFSGVPSGTAGRVANWAWDNGDPAIGPGSNGNVSTILVSDTLDKECFSGLYPGTGSQVAVFYSKLGSGASAWSAPKKISGSYDADRGTLTTAGSNVYAAWSSQTKYYTGTSSTFKCGSTYSFNTGDPRFDYFRRSTDNGSTWGPAYKLPGQSSTFRGDYMYVAATGSNVYITTTDVSNGHILLWISTNSGVSFANPINVGSAVTTNVDNTPGQTSGSCPCGYTGGFSGLPAIATDGSAIGIAYTATSSGAEKILICSTSGTSCTSATVAASGANANFGYSQAAANGSEMVFTWTTGIGAFSDVWTGGTGGSFGGVKKIASFPDPNFSGTACFSPTTACNQAGSGAIPVIFGSKIGISLTECNTVSTVSCDESQTLEKSRSILVWYESSDGGSTYASHALIQAPTSTSAKNTYMNEYGSAANVGGTPYVLFNGHDDVYGYYQVGVRSCSGC